MSNIASLIGGFDPDAYDTADNFEPLPPGEYPVLIEDAEVKDTKSGDGKFIKLKLAVTGDSFSGRKIFTNINIVNRNQQAVEIGLRALAQLTKVVGLPTVNDTSELVDKALVVRLKVKDGQNEVSTYKAIDGAAAMQPSAPRQAPQQQRPVQQAPANEPTPAQNGGAKKMPWQK